MLTPESYHNAWIAYVASTLLAILILYFWVGPRLSHGARVVGALVLAVAALTPAHPGTDINTWAPAVIVAGFEWLTSGAEAGMRPLRSLFVAEAMVIAFSLLAWLALRILDRNRGPEQGEPPDVPQSTS